MQLSNRFLTLVKQQLQSFSGVEALDKLVVYIAQSSEGDAPSFTMLDQWPPDGGRLPEIADDPSCAFQRQRGTGFRFAMTTSY